MQTKDIEAKNICLLLVVLLLLLGAPVAAQEDLSFRHLGKKDGLSQSSVFAITQDEAGLLWFGTRNGLNQYDGNAFKIFQPAPNSSNAIVDSDIRALYYDDNTDRLWIGTQNGVSCYDQHLDRFTNFSSNDGLSNGIIRFIKVDSKGNTFIGSSTALHLNYPDADLTFYPISYGPIEAKVLVEDQNQQLWLGTNQGLFQIKKDQQERFRLTPYEAKSGNEQILNDLDIRTMLIDSLGNFWIGSQEEGLFYWQVKAHQVQTFQHDENDPQSLSNNNIRTIALSPNGELWVGTFQGLNKLLDKQGIFHRYIYDDSRPESLSNSSVHHIFFDHRGGMWIGTYHGGVNYFDPDLNWFKNYSHLPHQNSISNDIVSTFVEDNKGNFWIGTEGGGLNYFEKDKQYFHHYPFQEDNINSLSGSNVKSIYDDGDSLWVGTFQAGLNLFVKSTQRFQSFQVGKQDPFSINNNNVYSIYRKEDYLWVLTFGGGLNLIHLPSKKTYYFRNQVDDDRSLSNDLGRVILEDKKGNIWIGTVNGLNLVRGKMPKISFERFFPDKKIFSLQMDRQGILWVGTFQNGLIAFDLEKDSLRQYQIPDGLPGNTIFGIQEDSLDNLWLSTNNGISKLDKERNLFTNFNYSNGLKNLEYNFNAHAQSKEGLILFGGTKGFTLFNPYQITPRTYFPELVFRDLKVQNQKIEVGDDSRLLKKSLDKTKQLCFKYNKANFSLGFAALDYFTPSNNQYAYKMEGLEKDWNYVRGQSEATYTIQRPGTYTFRIKTAGSDGNWSGKERQMEIKVLPPPWLSWWAYLSYFVIIAAVLIGVYSYQRLRHNLQLEQVAKQQQVELNELKLRFFTNITHEFRTPLTLILGPLEELITKYQEQQQLQKPLRNIHRNTHRLLTLVNQVLSFRKLETGNEKLKVQEQTITPFVKDIYSSFSGYAEKKKIQYRFISSIAEESTLWFDRQKMEIVLYNILSNAFKYTPERGNINCKIQESEEHIEIAIEDSGQGIPTDLHNKIFDRFFSKQSKMTNSLSKGTGIGLAISKQMVELHGGQIRVKSKPQLGSTFTIILPKGRTQSIESYTEEVEELVKHKEILPEPLVAIASQGKSDPIVAERIPTKSQKGIKLLIVEDNLEIQSYLCSIFDAEYEILCGNNGLEGLTLAQKELPDLIISDVMMPEMDGTQLVQKLKSDIQTSHIPIILLTARTAQPHKIEALALGADDYLFKPFHPREVQLKVNNLIKARQVMRQKFARIMNFDPKEINVSSTDELFLNRLMEVAENNISNTSFTAQDFARELTVSRPLLFIKLKALTNQTPNNFMKNIRMKRAAQLLLKTDLQVSEIAYQVGFKDTRYFSRCFAQEFEKNPREFRTQKTDY